jgi:AcrR family transcriptional regulator
VHESVGVGGRANQRLRTRRQLLEAAAQLVRHGGRPSLDEVAEAALVSRATAYRYFPNIESLLLEAALHVTAPDAAILKDAPPEVGERIQRVEDAFHEMMAANEPTLRLMLAQALERTAVEPLAAASTRQNRRLPLIEAALEPASGRCAPAALQRLAQALSLVIGSEGYIAAKDVLQLSDAETRALKRWTIRTLVAAVVGDETAARPEAGAP